MPPTASPADWIPIDWPLSWQQNTERLSLLKGTPINCLLCAETPSAEFKAAAQQAGLACLSPKEGTPTWRALKEVDWKTGAPVIAIDDGVWPKLDYKQGNTTDSAGPTGAPWLDANGWVIQLARVRAGNKPIWIHAPVPAENEVLTLSDYLLALNEAHAYGARRPIWLAPQHVEELAKAGTGAKTAWDSLSAALRFWQQHTEWQSWPVTAALLVASDFTGVNEYMGTEMLNLSARRNLPFQAIEPAQITAASLAGKKALLYVDQEPMPPEVANTVRAWVQKGGLLVASQKPAAQVGGMKPLNEPHVRYFLHSAGQGRIAVPKVPWDDPWILSVDTHLIMSRRHDPIRLFNSGSLSYHQQTAPGGKRSVVHLLNYARQAPAHEVSLQVTRPIRAARFLAPGAEPQPLKIERTPGQQEVYLPPFRVYGAIELEHSL